ncbi:16S rRNA (cytidine(1402)-2'-O)-methyltransferase [Patescibacteria group bacterium]|nr:16S rRNA (cytidine(1402)-2'-O)-methyltransferase [Patescibacteria group bacterium]MCL5797716.1 16S rRNA (cytidine(1402)-2'-O)-methyltransferase [Patescibacteria group bacterium]
MGTLYIVGTPIGNLDDITVRAIKTLFSVDYIACEDTRVTGQLLSSLELRMKNSDFIIKGIELKKPKLISFYDEIEAVKTPEIISLLIDGKNVALVSDSGMPLISDPGYKLVQECIKRDINYTVVPGASSLLSALILSGLPANNFMFLGYMPDTENKKLGVLNQLKKGNTGRKQSISVIFFETPHRLRATLETIREEMGEIDIVIVREMTKVHEEVWRGKISESILQFTTPKGEFVLLFRL